MIPDFVPGKPKGVVYKGRIERHPDKVWLIWSNKWGCWYRPNSQGYTSDILQAGLFDRETAASHMDAWPSKRAERTTEPFPLSAVRKHIKQAEAHFKTHVAQIESRIMSLNIHLEGRDHDQCEHLRSMWQDCGDCVALFARAALGDRS